MRKFTRLALIALLSVGVVATAASTPSMAAAVAPGGGVGVPPPPPPPGLPGVPPGVPGGGPPSTNCAALCGPIGAPASHVNYAACGAKLGALPIVPRAAIADIDQRRRVHLVPLCSDSKGHSLTEVETRYLERGNVGGLLPVIAANPVLAKKLARNGYKVNDVVGVLVGSNAALLYVHKQ